MKSAKVFKSGNSQAVRLPKDFQTTETEFLIQKIGNSIVLTPKSNPWLTFDKGISEFSSDFLSDGRNQPENQKREDL